MQHQAALHSQPFGLRLNGAGPGYKKKYGMQIKALSTEYRHRLLVIKPLFHSL